jgi:hypothetical protein
VLIQPVDYGRHAGGPHSSGARRDMEYDATPEQRAALAGV